MRVNMKTRLYNEDIVINGRYCWQQWHCLFIRRYAINAAGGHMAAITLRLSRSGYWLSHDMAEPCR